ncbi:uncharacterized protein LOC6611684 [Drosophila sechellia]|uniref:GM16929 n=1 Tax=Drosophila sechellia TaxID=7238 RepID=B4HYL1_DROSE|nr:uncharacterized protein LOC6611684 [Drosophila sechellia]EDW52141.1 GM16929 [Drosophila sechellia]
MESRVTSGTGPPNTIMIQLVSQQPSSCGQMQAMPISVQTIPLFPNSRTSTERPCRSASIAPNVRPPTDVPPPRRNFRIRPEEYGTPKRKNSQSQFRNFSRGMNQPPPVYYVLRPEDGVMPIYIPPPRFNNGQGARMATECPCCGHAKSLCTEEPLGVHRAQKQFVKLEKETPGHRDQCTNTIDQADVGNIRTIYETLGRAMVTAAVEAAQRSQPAGPSDPTNVILKLLTQLGEQNQTTSWSPHSDGGAGSPDHQPDMSRHKASFSETVRVVKRTSSDPAIAKEPPDELDDERRLPSVLSDGRLHVDYPKTPRPTPTFSVESENTLDSGYSPNLENSIGHSQA